MIHTPAALALSGPTDEQELILMAAVGMQGLSKTLQKRCRPPKWLLRKKRDLGASPSHKWALAARSSSREIGTIFWKVGVQGRFFQNFNRVWST